MMDPAKAAAAFKRAVQNVGGAAAAAEICATVPGKTCSRQNIHQLLKNERPCPAEFVRVMSDASGVRRSELRADLYPEADEPTEPPPGWGRREDPGSREPRAEELEAAGQLSLLGGDRDDG